MSAESAVFVEHKATLDDLEDDYDRVYFGNEFCDKRLPRPREVRDVYDYCSANGLEMTFVTPIMTPTKTSEIADLLDELCPIASDLELVFNDWGVYQMADERGRFEDLIAGRIFSGQKRGPSISHLSGDSDVQLQDEGRSAGDEALDHFQKSTVNVPYARDHFAELGVDRVELDILTHGMYDEDIDFSASVYYPWNFVSVRRWCQESTSAPLCDRNCDENVYVLDNQPAMPEKLYRKNNVIFTYNDDVPDTDYLDRTVFMPDPVN